MSKPPIQRIVMSDHVTLSERHPDYGCKTNNWWWLYDSRARMNLAMRAPSQEAALFEAVEYWANRALKAEKAHTILRDRVDIFIGGESQEETSPFDY